MAIHKITYAAQHKRAHLYHHGCNFRCKGCSYLLKPPYEPGTSFLSLEEIKEVLRGLDVERVHFLGGEPTTNPDLPELARFAHEELGAYTKIGHTNGSILPPPHVDATSVSIKAFTNALHLDYTGASNAPVLENFTEAYRAGVEMEASSVLIPEYIDCNEIEKIAQFIADIDARIPYHITGYVPPPDSSWRNATREEVERAADVASRYLNRVTFSALTVEEFTRVDTHTRYGSVIVAQGELK